MPHLMRFVTAQALAPTATMKRSDSNSHQMNERPRSHSSRVVVSIMPRATLSKMMPISRPIASAGAGEEFMRESRTDGERVEGRGRPPRRAATDRGGFHPSRPALNSRRAGISVSATVKNIARIRGLKFDRKILAIVVGVTLLALTA